DVHVPSPMNLSRCLSQKKSLNQVLILSHTLVNVLSLELVSNPSTPSRVAPYITSPTPVENIGSWYSSTRPPSFTGYPTRAGRPKISEASSPAPESREPPPVSTTPPPRRCRYPFFSICSFTIPRISAM